MRYSFNKNGKAYQFNYQQPLTQQQLQYLYDHAEEYWQKYCQKPAAMPETQSTPKPVEKPTQPVLTEKDTKPVLKPTKPVLDEDTTKPGLKPGKPNLDEDTTKPGLKPGKPNLDEDTTKPGLKPGKPNLDEVTTKPGLKPGKPNLDEVTTKPGLKPGKPVQASVPQVTSGTQQNSQSPAVTVPKPEEDEKTQHLSLKQKEGYGQLKKKLQDLQSQMAQTQGELEANTRALQAKKAEPQQALSRQEDPQRAPATPDSCQQEIQTLETKQKELEEKQKKLQEDLKNELACESNFLLKPKTAKLHFGASSDRWPSNTQIVASAHEGQYSFGSRFVDTLAKAAQNTPSLPDAVASVERKPVLRDETETQLPVTSAQTVSGWKKDDRQTPRRVLIIQGAHDPEKKDLEGMQSKAKSYKEMAMREYGVPAENIVILEEKDRKAIEAEMERMRAFAKDNPGAEAMVALVGHGWGTVRTDKSRFAHEPGIAPEDIEKEGAAVGNFWLGGKDHLREPELKDMFRKYLSEYKSVMGIVNSCSSGAWIAQGEPRRTQEPFGGLAMVM